jgi:hypothetical protein
MTDTLNGILFSSLIDDLDKNSCFEMHAILKISTEIM